MMRRNMTHMILQTLINDSTLGAAAVTQNMHCELCINGDAAPLIEELALGGTV